ncbi:DUF3800 domain-containing protein [Rothia nasimurium]|uniref:DUF3800 domain-containing protein n=1 Tax=Rothia nasimurium TaxID=85336 RepID=UPI001F369DEC|nr:DUF3800 domain-containing protein [Rothia nasimurium]
MYFYFDESGNTGSIRLDNYLTQPYFAYGGFGCLQEEKQEILEKYREFKKKYAKLKTDKGETVNLLENGEIKGNALLTREANPALKFFIENFVNKNFYINIYKKEYFIATLFCYFLYGIGYSIYDPNQFYLDASRYEKNKGIIKHFIQYCQTGDKTFLDDSLKACLQESIVQDSETLRSRIESILNSDEVIFIDDYFEIVTKYRDNSLVNVVNIPAFGELVELIKLNGVKIEKMYIDRIQSIDKEIIDTAEPFFGIPIENKAPHDEVELLEIVDNYVSITMKSYKSFLEDIDGTKNLTDFTWNMDLFAKLVKKTGYSNIKVTVPVEEYMALGFPDLILDNKEFSNENIHNSHFLRMMKWQESNLLSSDTKTRALNRVFNL